MRKAIILLLLVFLIIGVATGKTPMDLFKYAWELIQIAFEYIATWFKELADAGVSSLQRAIL